MLSGFTFEAISPSEGYLAKLQQRAATGLASFSEDLRRHLLTEPLVYWDDTVVMVNKNRSCLRFYGNEQLALYKAHTQKNKVGMLKDQILSLLPKETQVMHDHNRVNYGADFSYSDVECNAHLLRDLQKCTDNTGHQWSEDLANVIRQTNQSRNERIENGEAAFSALYVSQFFLKVEKSILLGNEENQRDQNIYYTNTEKALLKRLIQYWVPYFSWVVNFDLLFTNNVSERGLRGVKSKMKISGQFQTITSARNYATIRSYCETCKRNGINPMSALLSLARGKPLTLEEILK